MPAARKTRKRTGISIPPDIERAMNEIIESGEYTTRAEIIHIAVRFWLNYRDFDIEAEIERYLQSEKGERLILEIVKKSRKKPVKK